MEPQYHNFQTAHSLIRTYINRTPTIRARFLDRFAGASVYLKCENLQVTRSFKARGAFHALLTLSPNQREKGVVTRSSGNFARALAYAGRELGISTTIVMPEDSPQTKIQATALLATKLIIHGKTHAESERLVAELTEREGLSPLSPYDHWQVLIGQGTAAVEILEEIHGMQTFLCPVGGGGLMGGCANALKSFSNTIQVIGVEPRAVSDFAISLAKGERIELANRSETLADGLKAPKVGVIPWQVLKHNVDRAQTVSEEEIMQAMTLLYEELGFVIEPSGAVAVAALLQNEKQYQGTVVCMVSGGNVDEDVFRRCLTFGRMKNC